MPVAMFQWPKQTYAATVFSKSIISARAATTILAATAIPLCSMAATTTAPTYTGTV